MEEAIHVIGWIILALIAAGLIFAIVAGTILPEVPDFVCDFIGNIGIEELTLAGCT